MKVQAWTGVCALALTTACGGIGQTGFEDAADALSALPGDPNGDSGANGAASGNAPDPNSIGSGSVANRDDACGAPRLAIDDPRAADRCGDKLKLMLTGDLGDAPQLEATGPAGVALTLKMNKRGKTCMYALELEATPAFVSGKYTIKVVSPVAVTTAVDLACK